MSGPSQPQKVRQDPRFAMNALMRYMIAPAARRYKLIRDQKYPPVFQSIWYEAACNAISRFIASGMQDETMLSGEMSRLAGLVPANDQEAQKNEGNIEAIESFLNSYDQIQLNDLEPSLGTNVVPGLLISGVQISVRPDIELRGAVRGRNVVGAMKLYFSKVDPLTDAAAQYGAVTIKRYCEGNLAGGASVRPADCSVFDVFAGRLYVAPVAVSRRNQDLEAACDEIALRWPTI